MVRACFSVRDGIRASCFHFANTHGDTAHHTPIPTSTAITAAHASHIFVSSCIYGLPAQSQSIRAPSTITHHRIS